MEQDRTLELDRTLEPEPALPPLSSPKEPLGISSMPSEGHKSVGVDTVANAKPCR